MASYMEEAAVDGAFTPLVCITTCVVNRKIACEETHQAAARSDAPVAISLTFSCPACGQFEKVYV